MKTRGRRRPPDAELLIAQVREEFGKKKKEKGAEAAARELGVCLASFYNYVNGKALPGLEVLRNANQKWGIKWKWMDLSEILPKRQIQTPEQYVFSFLQALRQRDVEVVEVGPLKPGPRQANVLQVTLKIRFSA